MKVSNGKLQGIFVTADDPRFLEKQVEPDRELLNLESLNVAEIRAHYIARQKNFDTTPFDPEGRMLRLFPGGYTIWSGYPGSGKTTMLRQLACHLMHQGKHVMIASLEESEIDVFYRHACVALGTDDPQQPGLEWCVHHWEKSLRIWSSPTLPAPHQRLFAAVRVLAATGVRHVIIDSLMCIDVSNGDWEGQRQFANALLKTIKGTGIHVHLVAHPRKIINSDQDPDINDVAGAADLGRLADNIIFVRRSKNESTASSRNVTPMRFAVLKQRHGSGALGDCIGWFHRDRKQFKHDQFDDSLTRYLPEEAYAEQDLYTQRGASDDRD